eukprot:28929_1
MAALITPSPVTQTTMVVNYSSDDDYEDIVSDDSTSYEASNETYESHSDDATVESEEVSFFMRKTSDNALKHNGVHKVEIDLDLVAICTVTGICALITVIFWCYKW